MIELITVLTVALQGYAVTFVPETWAQSRPVATYFDERTGITFPCNSPIQQNGVTLTVCDLSTPDNKSVLVYVR